MSNLDNFFNAYIQYIEDVYTDDDNIITELINKIPFPKTLDWEMIVDKYEGLDLYDLAGHLLGMSINIRLEDAAIYDVKVYNSLTNSIVIWITQVEHFEEEVSKLLDTPEYKFLIDDPRYNINFDLIY